MYFVNSPYILSNLSKRNLIWHIPTQEKELFLTFDDGPQITVTPWVLDVLKSYEVKATFFCVGENVKRNPEVFARIIREGHSTGNHTFNHLNAWDKTLRDYIDNVDLANSFIHTHLFRPPYGKLKIAQIRHIRRNYAIILWSVLSGDFDKHLAPEKCLRNVIMNTTPGSIVVFHDSLKAENNLRYALPKFIENFLEEGYSFKPLTLESCIRNSSVQKKYLAKHIPASVH